MSIVYENGISSIYIYESMISFGGFANHTLSDASKPWQLGLQDPATPIMEAFFSSITI